MTKKTTVSANESATKKASAPRTAASLKRHGKATPSSTEKLVQSAAPVVELDRQEVARLAYSYWVERNYRHGSQVEDWFRAESELRRRLGA